MWKVIKKLRANAAGLSDDEIRELLRNALVKVESGPDIDWLYIDAYFEADSTVVYTVRNRDSLSETFHREYTLDTQAQTVELGTDRQRATRKVTYEIAPAANAAPRKLTSLTFTYSPDNARDSVLSQLTRTLTRTLGITSLQGDSLSDVDLREALWKALQSSVVGFIGIEEVMPTESLVVYSTYIEETGMYSLYWRTFTATDTDGIVNVALNDDEAQVQPVTRYEPVAQPTAQRKPCPCNPATQKEGDPRMDEKLKAVIDGLIANSNGRFTEDDRAKLSVFSADQLATLVSAFTPPATTPKEATDTKPADDATPAPTANKDVTDDQLTQAIEKRVLAAIEKKDSETRRNELATRLMANATAKATLDDLGIDPKTLTIESLEKVAAKLNVNVTGQVDFSGRGLPCSRVNTDADNPPPPPDLSAAIRSHRGIAQPSTAAKAA